MAIINYALLAHKTTQNGVREMYQCEHCHEVFSETKGTFLEGLRKPISLISQIFKVRSGGASFNQTCKDFNIAKER